MRYRVGIPGWKLASRLGVPVHLRVNIFYDDESHSYWAESPDLDGLVVSGTDLDDLKCESLSAARALLELQLRTRPKATADFHMDFAVPA
jgi:predicted RNase H-like HicB family nuclease